MILPSSLNNLSLPNVVETRQIDYMVAAFADSITQALRKAIPKVYEDQVSCFFKLHSHQRNIICERNKFRDSGKEIVMGQLRVE